MLRNIVAVIMCSSVVVSMISVSIILSVLAYQFLIAGI